MSESVSVVAKITARPDTIADTRALVVWLAAESRKEPGCLRYEVLQNEAEPAVFVLVELWANAAALDAHNQTPHVAAAFAKAPALLGKELDRGVFKTVG